MVIAERTNEGVQMGLRDKAKGLYEDHKDQIHHGLDKAKETVNKAGESINQRASGRLPDSGTYTPVGDAAAPGDAAAGEETEAEAQPDD